MTAMVWIAIGGLIVLVTIVLFASARRADDAVGDRDLGKISSGWLNQNRAREWESSHNR